MVKINKVPPVFIFYFFYLKFDLHMYTYILELSPIILLNYLNYKCNQEKSK